MQKSIRVRHPATKTLKKLYPNFISPKAMSKAVYTKGTVKQYFKNLFAIADLHRFNDELRKDMKTLGFDFNKRVPKQVSKAIARKVLAKIK